MLIKPNKNEYPKYYSDYINSVEEGNILEIYKEQTQKVVNLYRTFFEEKLLFRYAENKWSIKELLAHLIDSEIIMGYRALTYARKDKTNLPMYDHDKYINVNSLDKINSDLLINHFKSIRESNLFLFNSLTEENWNEVGLTGSKNFTTRCIPYIIVGHTNHHISILKERYL